MRSRCLFQFWFSRIVIPVAALFFLVSMVQCGGGGGGGGGGETISVTGTVGDGTGNRVIGYAQCRFTDQDGVQRAQGTASSTGEFRLRIPADMDGTITCNPPGLSKLTVFTVASTKGSGGGGAIQDEHVNPITTLVAQIIQSEQASDPLGRKATLLSTINKKADPDLNLLADISSQMYASMLDENLDVDFGGGEGGSGGSGGGGVGGEGGDGGDASPISNAYCEFIANDGLKSSGVLYFPALADFMDDGVLNRSDLADIADTMESTVSGSTPEAIRAAFARIFPDGMGRRCSAVADETGNYFIETPANVPGYVRCFPPDQQQLMLATYVRGHGEDEKLLNEDVTPTTTFFSHHIASQLSGDLNAIKENFFADTAGLGDVHIVFSGDTVIGFELLPGSDPADGDTGLVGFGSTALFNVLYKNGVNMDYLSLLQDFVEDKSVTPEALEKLGLSSDLALAWSTLANLSVDTAAQALGADLASALSRARLTVTVTDAPGGEGLDGATVKVVSLDGDMACESCGSGNLMVTENGVARFEFSGVPAAPAEISLEIYGVAGYADTTATVQIVAVASVDLEVPLAGSAGGESPDVSITSPTSEATYTSDANTVSVSGSASDNVGVSQVRWSNNRGGSGTCDGTDTWSASISLYQGANVITITAEDGDGNSGTDTLTVSFVPTDPSLPTVVITSPTSAATMLSGAAVLDMGGTAGAADGIDEVTWSNDRGGSGTCSGSDTWSAQGIALSEGVNVITVTATDTGGQTGTDTLAVTYDLGAPQVRITSPTLSSSLVTGSNVLSIGGTASDEGGVDEVTWSNDRGGSGTCSGTDTWSAQGVALYLGENLITVTATDTAGNSNTDTLTVSYDNAAPAVAITSPTAESTWVTGTAIVNIGGMASDTEGVAEVTWYNNRAGGGICNGRETWSTGDITLLSGANVITITAKDNAGNTVTDTLTAIYDNIPPTVTITAPTSASSYTTTLASLDIGGSASDNVGVTLVTWSNDRGGSGTCSGTTSWSSSGVPLALGANVITVTATDALGNTGTGTLTVELDMPDLVISTGSPTATPSTVHPGDTVTLSGWTVRNQGDAAAGGFANGFYLSTDAVITTTDAYLTGNSNASGLAAGAEADWGGPTLTIPSGTSPGTYYIGILVDRSSTVAESDEGNNYVSRQITVITEPDLMISSGSPTVTPTTVHPGDTVALSNYTISNQGDAASGGFYNGFYLSTNTLITTGDTYITGNYFSSGLAAGAQATLGGPTLTIPSGTSPGTYYLGILVDRTNVVAESNETNNYVYRQITVITEPDLVITSGSPTVSQTSVLAGMSVALSSWTVRNQGDAAAGGFSNGFYLSTNTTITTFDTYITGNSNPSGLAVGAQSTWGGPTLTIPASTPVGYYYIGILVDRTNAVAESSESNNYVSTERIYVYHLN